MRIGFIGLGRMGMPMCRNLLAAGHDLIVYNRSRDQRIDLLVADSAREASSPAEVAESASELILTCLPTVDATESVFLGAGGLVAHARSDQVMADLSTVGPRTARRVADAARDRGAGFLDAPVSGGPDGARKRSLTIMVGGEDWAYARAKPIFEVLGSNVWHVGNNGAGCVAKLVNQHLCFVHAVAAAETITLGARAGADPESLLKILKTSWGQSFMLERLVPRFVKRDFEPGAPLRLYEKDLDLVMELGRELGVPVPMAEAAKDRLRAALGRGLEGADAAAVILPYEEETGFEKGARVGA